MRVLVVRLSSIGDVVHTLPTLAALAHAGHEVGWIVEPAARPLLEGHPLLSRGVVAAPPARGIAPGPARATLRSLRSGKYDVALDLQGLWKSAGWARASGAGRAVGFARRSRREPSSALLLTERIDQPATVLHVIDKNLALLRALGIESLGLREFPLPAMVREDEEVAEELRQIGFLDFVVLNPGGGWESKLWPAASFGALARGLLDAGLRSLVTWGPGEEGLADRVVAASAGSARRSFPTTLRQYVALARRARLVVAADTGPMHIACAVGTPVVALFGPTDPERNGPFRPADLVVRRAPSCAPCYGQKCKVHTGVMAGLGVDEVLAAARERLASASREGPRAV